MPSQNNIIFKLALINHPNIFHTLLCVIMRLCISLKITKDTLRDIQTQTSKCPLYSDARTICSRPRKGSSRQGAWNSIYSAIPVKEAPFPYHPSHLGGGEVSFDSRQTIVAQWNRGCILINGTPFRGEHEGARNFLDFPHLCDPHDPGNSKVAVTCKQTATGLRVYANFPSGFQWRMPFLEWIH